MTNVPCIERTLLIDADDTLWENNIFYLRCLVRFQEMLESLGYDRETVAKMVERCEAETIVTHGYGPQGFIAALKMACDRLLRERGQQMVVDLIQEIDRMTESIIQPPMVVLAGVESTLAALRPTTQCILVTKGDEETQRSKITRSGLEHYFEAQYIVAEKDVQTYRMIAAEEQLDPRCTWMVGNSPRSDINPAVEAGLGAILIPHDHTWKVEIEEIEHPGKVTILRRFSDLLPFLGVDSGT